ncbi:MAG: YeeE/YedE family protein [Caldilineales bacterium]|nr:YeeE/YedE family protein [Caldilineales bacterium]
MTTVSHAKPLAKTKSKEKAASIPRPFVNPYLGGVFLGLVLFLAFFLTGNGLGASGGLNRIIVWVIDLAAPQYADRVSYLIQYAGGDKNALDNWIVLLTAGIFLGGLISGLVGRRVHLETVRGPQITAHQRWVFAVIGGVIAGFGARMAKGCTSGQGLSGGATLSVGSWAFLMAFFVGGYALAYTLRKLWTPAPKSK